MKLNCLVSFLVQSCSQKPANEFVNGVFNCISCYNKLIMSYQTSSRLEMRLLDCVPQLEADHLQCVFMVMNVRLAELFLSELYGAAEEGVLTQYL